MPVPAGGNAASESGRLIGPDEAYRVVFLRDGRARARGYSVPLFADEAASIPADVLTLSGEDIIDSTLIVDVHSRIPQFQYPVGTDVVYTSINGGPIVPLYARVDDRLDNLAEAVADFQDAVTAAISSAVSAVNAEQAARVAGDNALDVRLDAVETSTTTVTADLADLSATVAALPTAAPRVDYLDAYNDFFGSVPWVTGQGNTATTLSAPASAGATTLTVASATGLLTGVLLVTGAGTANQQLLTVTNVAGSVLTVSPAVGTALASGATVAPVWTNASHITFDAVGGSRAYGYWLAHAKRADGSYVISGGAGQTVVWLGDSWTAESMLEFNRELDTRLGETNVINAGVPGNRLSQMIARFATDVAPHNPDYVVLEYGVNDVYAGVTSAVMADELEQAVALCRSIGAAVVIPGVPPLSEYPAQSRDRNLELIGQTSGPNFPAVTFGGVSDLWPYLQSQRNPTSLRLGVGAQGLASGVRNVAIGQNAQQVATTGLGNIALGADTQKALTTGSNNVAVGDQAQNKLTTPNYNVAVGQAAQFNLTTAIGATALGGLAQFNLTTGNNNTALGGRAQQAMTTAAGNTAVGYQAQASATTGDNNVGIGHNAQAAMTTGTNNVCVGRGSQTAMTTGQVNVAVGDQAQANLTTSLFNTGVGSSSQYNLTTGNSNTALGGQTQFNLTTGHSNTAIGQGAQYQPGNVAANATTTADGQTSVGYQSGQATTAASSFITTIGYQSTAAGAGSVSLGANASASGAGSLALGYQVTATAAGAVAIGRDSTNVAATATAANDFILGTAAHVVQVPGTLRLPAGTATKAPLRIAPGVAPTSPVDGDIWVTTAGLFVRIAGATVGPLS
ncbi:GDSL-type esterase/lipase family protein [Micromonospora sp. WMMD737]|uniref:GDSL-type esterase/lipase family protein n=1 Tax=Micromonospora sp. WMMD737 TaxID=3404113 RepID=UPI003B926666